MSTSSLKCESNRLNSLKSTGPRTPEGKARSSRNAVTHGIFCREVVLLGESHTAFEILCQEFIREHKPQTMTELAVVERLVSAQWKLNRVAHSESLLHESRGEDLSA